MTTSKMALKRPRRPNGQRRASRVYSVRDIHIVTESRIDELAAELRLRRGQIIDQAVEALWQRTFPEEAERQNARQVSEYTPEDMAWLMRPQERLSAEDDPKIADLERALDQRRRRRDEIMGRSD